MYVTADTFKARNPLVDPTMYVAIAAAVTAWHASHSIDAAIAPVVTWLGLHGWIRGRGVLAASRYAIAAQLQDPAPLPPDALAQPTPADVAPVERIDANLEHPG